MCLKTLQQYPGVTAQAAVTGLLLISKTDLSPVPDELHLQLTALNTIAPIGDAGEVDSRTAVFGSLPKVLPRLRPSATEALRRLYAGWHDCGGKLLRVEGLVEFSDRASGREAIRAVQHTLYSPRRLERWPDADCVGRLIFVVRDLEPDEIIEPFAAGDPVCMALQAGGN